MPSLRCTAFADQRLLAAGELRHVALKAKQAFDAAPGSAVRVFDDCDGSLLELPLDQAMPDLLQQLAAGVAAAATEDEADNAQPADAPRGRGRPRLGVVAREVTLLPRQWRWLAAQPGGASVALRRLVDAARRAGAGGDRVRAAQEAAYRFATAMVGDAPGYVPAMRALFAGDAGGFEQAAAAWPPDVREHAAWLARAAWSR